MLLTGASPWVGRWTGLTHRTAFSPNDPTDRSGPMTAHRDAARSGAAMSMIRLTAGVELRPPWGGNPARCYYAERLPRARDFSGWSLTEFKYCPPKDDLMFMEFNAKLWASCEFTFLDDPRLAPASVRRRGRPTAGAMHGIRLRSACARSLLRPPALWPPLVRAHALVFNR